MNPNAPTHVLSATVVIVEDDDAVAQLIAEAVHRAGRFRCIARYSTSEEAIAAAPGLQPDIILLDINLPALSGIECVRMMKPHMPATHFLMLTVYEDFDYIFAALAAGAVGYLLKRSIATDLPRALEEAMSGGSPMTTAIARKVVQSFHGRTRTLEVSLSPREHEVLRQLAAGHLYKEIADRLGLGLPTVSTYVRRIYEKLHVNTRAQAVAKYEGRG